MNEETVDYESIHFEDQSDVIEYVEPQSLTLDDALKLFDM